ncbi:MAG: TonB-dependent receptor [Arenicellaceae bacterium]|nr:TonB-dependent receptor [Arenicellaceae bacterium]
MQSKTITATVALSGLLINVLASDLAMAQNSTSETNAGLHLEEIRVLAHPLSEDGTAQSITVLNGDELAKSVQGSLGETLKNEPGIQSASFGSAVGRPVIHGLGGARVKTTQDRIDSLDVSVTSGDHAVSVEPFIANQISVLKGASTLLYGSSAIGGVVDVETGRIAKEHIDGFQGRAQLRAADNANARSGAIRLDAQLSENMVLHFDGFVSDADDYDIPGETESLALREAEEAAGKEHEEEGEESGVLVGSRAQRQGGALGLSYVGDRGFFGFSASALDAEYGLFGHGHEEEGHEEEGHEEEEHEEGEEPGMIDMSQTRFDIEAELDDPFAGFMSLNFRLGINDYKHREIEGDGVVATEFNNDAWEARLQLQHLPWNEVSGTFGLQANSRQYSAIGEEAFVPPVDTESAGIFWVGERDFSSFDIETGLRLEKLRHKPTAVGLQDRDFSTVSASFGVIRPVNEQLTLSALIDYSSRAPTIEEIYSNGPHLATNSFEIGDPGLGKERATGLTLTAGFENGLIELDASVYYMDFSDFIYQQNTLAVEDDLPVFNYQQNDASFAGLDLKGLVHLGVVGGGDLDFTFLFDTVRGELGTSLNSNDNLPRIPASRVGVGFSWISAAWSIDADWSFVDGQQRTAFGELPTDSYNDLALYIGRTIQFGDNELTLFLQGRNLTDEEQRYHASIVKDIAPAAGRSIEIGARMLF